VFKFPKSLSAQQFLVQHWQKKPLFMPAALDALRPSVSRHELAWLATLDDVESRIVFVDRDKARTRYRVMAGPFEAAFLQKLPKRDWTLLVHDVEKHVPAMRALFANVPFIPDWRIDDLMISFAAPGGGVGPHRDHYDVFLCQGIGRRQWRYTPENIPADTDASSDIVLLAEFSGPHCIETTAGDVLYLPPGVAHWGQATRACMTYSIGMRAPRLSELVSADADIAPEDDRAYQDADLRDDESRPGSISPRALQRANALVPAMAVDQIGAALGCAVTQTKVWLTPNRLTNSECDTLLAIGGRLNVHGMARVAFDDTNIYLNGRCLPMSANMRTVAASLCKQRHLSRRDVLRLENTVQGTRWLQWMLAGGAFDVALND
jgi:50S ribosomal protein L16 3-hydroxylase